MRRARWLALAVAMLGACHRPTAAASTAGGEARARPAVAAPSANPAAVHETAGRSAAPSVVTTPVSRRRTARMENGGLPERPRPPEPPIASPTAESALWQEVAATAPGAVARRSGRDRSPGKRVEVLRGRARAGWRTVEGGAGDEHVEVLRGRPDAHRWSDEEDGFGGSAPLPFVDDAYPVPFAGDGYGLDWQPALPFGGGAGPGPWDAGRGHPGDGPRRRPPVSGAHPLGPPPLFPAPAGIGRAGVGRAPAGRGGFVRPR